MAALAQIGQFLCGREHYCVVCGDRALVVPHGVRGRVNGPTDHCSDDFFVRCDACRRGLRKVSMTNVTSHVTRGLLPDPAKYIPWWELTDEEAFQGKAKDGRKIFYELI